MIRLESVSKRYKKGSFFGREFVNVLKNVSLKIEKGEHVGIIGESGAGKSTLCRILSLLELPDSGSVFLEDEKITKKNIKAKRGMVGMVFQDPATSLDPLMSIRDTLREAKKLDNDELKVWLEKVGLDESVLKRRPSELSGGQQQRVAIARTLISGAEYVVFDEFTSALDVSTQAKIVNMICDLNRDKDFAFIFVSHDVKLIGYLSDRIYVIYKGEIVEKLVSLKESKHPYTKALLESRVSESKVGDVSYDGCSFYPFCPYRMDKCKDKKPQLYRLSENSCVRCFLYD
ncbi:ABC transporter ATP-binding protein [Hippea alviniae]|uniref:ABC transporter ATP-binding protein n=1 Tax=Hippea alviniae TaxID=1279027 RepID=UPI0003B52820|nr:ABC transporter ATP-binding protein [Hippea alviniae]